LLLKHADSLRLFGGAEGIRDEGALDSALARPKDAWSYRCETSIPRLAAAYAFGLAKNHPFVDGNKRAAFLACVGFPKINGLNLRAPQPDAYRSMIALAAGEITEDDFAQWLEAHVQARPQP
jgi:death-on-curing protein